MKEINIVLFIRKMVENVNELKDLKEKKIKKDNKIMELVLELRYLKISFFMCYSNINHLNTIQFILKFMLNELK